MRRTPIVLAATVLGTAGVLLFKPIPTTVAVAAPSSDGASSTTATEDAATPTPSASASGSASASASTVKDGTFTGTAETTRFGTTQVSATVSGGKITEVTAVQLNQDDSRSLQISEAAAPTLRQEVLTAQTAAVDTVSGATWTSAAYEASLQSALDQAGYTAPDGSTASLDLSTLQESGGGPGH